MTDQAKPTYPKEFPKKMEVESGFWGKKELQSMIKDVKKQGVEVIKEGMAYRFYMTSPKTGNKILVMVALNGRNNYLTRAWKGWLTVGA